MAWRGAHQRPQGCATTTAKAMSAMGFFCGGGVDLPFYMWWYTTTPPPTSYTGTLEFVHTLCVIALKPL